MVNDFARPIVREDIHRIVDLRVEIFKSIGKIPSGEEENNLKEINKRYFEDLYDKNRFCGYCEDYKGAIVSIALGIILEFPPINLADQGKVGYIFNVYTEERFRNQAKASSITQMLIDELWRKGANKIELDANEKSVDLYKRLGFKISDNHMVLRK